MAEGWPRASTGQKPGVSPRVVEGESLGFEGGVEG
ncbi:hypothetical protein QG37_04761 [Candidozyma auris]|nr:hypothetical protein QG37_04761 [[Candida] auris]